MNQFFQEMRDGSRIPVTEEEWQAARKCNNYQQVHAYGVVVVYRMK